MLGEGFGEEEDETPLEVAEAEMGCEGGTSSRADSSGSAGSSSESDSSSHSPFDFWWCCPDWLELRRDAGWIVLVRDCR